LAQSQPAPAASLDTAIEQNAQRRLEEGRKIFRFDTFGSEDFWGGKLGCTGRSWARNWEVSVPA
jgi:hypothetical protein